MTDRFTHDAAPYVLGALPPEDRLAFEAHLAECPECAAQVREFAGLPGLLSRLPAADVPDVLEGEPAAPRSLMPALLSRARRHRRARRWRTLAVGAIAACLAVVGTVAVVDAVHRAPAVHQTAALAFQRSVPTLPVSAEATLTDMPDATRIQMTCRYSGALDGRPHEYVLRVVPKGGQPEQLASWPVRSTYDYGVDVVTAHPRDRIDRLEVTSGSGRVLLTLRL
jgi:Putative zinc-finger